MLAPRTKQKEQNGVNILMWSITKVKWLITSTKKAYKNAAAKLESKWKCWPRKFLTRF